MTKTSYTLTWWMIIILVPCHWNSALGQISYSANDFVQPYHGHFHPAANLGQYTAFSEEELALLAAGGKPAGEEAGQGTIRS